MGEFRMPSLGADMETGTIVEWRVAPGDEVHRGDIVAVIDTEKSTIEVEVFEDGVVEELLQPEGAEVDVGTPLARIGTASPGAAVAARPPGEAAGGTSVAEPTTSVRAPTPAPAAAGTPHVVSPLVRHLADDLEVDVAQLAPSGPGGLVTRADVERAAAPHRAKRPPAERHHSTDRITATPLARRRAAALGIDLATVPGSGPTGAVVARDLEAVEPAEPTAPGRGSSPAGSRADVTAARGSAPSADSLRAAIGALMSRSKREIPHYYVATTIDLGATMTWLASANAERPVSERILPAAVLLTGAARAASEVAIVNGHWLDGTFQPAGRVDLGVAISLRSGGLVAPAITGADELSIDEMMSRLRDLVARARKGALRASEMIDPTITVTNLGDQGADSVLPVIYPPQVAMVGLGKVVERPWAVDGMLTVRPVVTATLAGDHRAHDGHDGARFLAALERRLQRPQDL